MVRFLERERYSLGSRRVSPVTGERTLRKGGGPMHHFCRTVMPMVLIGFFLSWSGMGIMVSAWGQGVSTPLETKTVIGDLLMVDGEFYIVRGPEGEIQIERTPKTQISEEFKFGDRIKALVLMNNKALKIERAGSHEDTGVVINTPLSGAVGKGEGLPAPSQPDTKTIVADVLMIDGEFYIVRTEYGEVQIEVTPETKLKGELKFGSRIKAVVLMNDEALSIEPAGPNDVPGVVIHRATPDPVAKSPGSSAAKKPEGISKKKSASDSDTRVVEGDVLMVDGDFYILRGPKGEIQVERTADTRMTEEFNFGDRIKARVLKNNKALSIERAQ